MVESKKELDVKVANVVVQTRKAIVLGGEELSQEELLVLIFDKVSRLEKTLIGEK